MLIKLVDIKNFTKLNSYEEDGFTSILINRKSMTTDWSKYYFQTILLIAEKFKYFSNFQILKS